MPPSEESPAPLGRVPPVSFPFGRGGAFSPVVWAEIRGRVESQAPRPAELEPDARRRRARILRNVLDVYARLPRKELAELVPGTVERHERELQRLLDELRSEHDESVPCAVPLAPETTPAPAPSERLTPAVTLDEADEIVTTEQACEIFGITRQAFQREKPSARWRRFKAPPGKRGHAFSLRQLVEWGEKASPQWNTKRARTMLARGPEARGSVVEKPRPRRRDDRVRAERARERSSGVTDCRGV